MSSSIADPQLLLQSRPVLGKPIIVQIINPKGINNSHYVAAYEGTKRLTYDWINTKTNTVTLNVKPPKKEADYSKPREITLQYYKNGGYIATGQLLATVRVSIENPLMFFEIKEMVGNDHYVEVRYQLSIEVPEARVTITTADATQPIRLCHQRITPKLLQGTIHVPKPRLSGDYIVSVLYGVGGDSKLGSQ
eukprot:PhF_6_TR40678/c0_g1_i2/m.61110